MSRSDTRSVFTSYEDVRLTLGRLFRPAGLVNEDQIFPMHNAEFGAAETVKGVFEPFESDE